MTQSFTGTQHEATMFLLKQNIITQQLDHVLMKEHGDNRCSKTGTNVFKCTTRACKAKFCVTGVSERPNVVKVTIVRNHRECVGRYHVSNVRTTAQLQGELTQNTL